jgi:hypothetical protein
MMADLVRKTIAEDPVIKRLRQRIVDRETMIQRRCAKRIDDNIRKEYAARLLKAGVPILPSETKRWTQ